jgi:hypothetical protein
MNHAPSDSGSVRAVERAVTQFEALRNAYRGYLPWSSDNTDVKTRLLQIEDMDKAFFAAIAMLSHAQTPFGDAHAACIELAAKHGYATGHGDTIADMIREFSAQIPIKD